MIIGYARTSTDDQDLARQIKQLKDLGVPEHLIYCDAGVSGAKEPEKRTGYRQLMKLIETGEVKELAITDLSRLGRDSKGTLQEIWNLQDKGIKIISLSELDKIALEAEPWFQPMLFSAFTLSADLQRKKIVDDTKAGLKRAASEGRYPGRPKVKIEFTKIKQWQDKGFSERAAVRICGYSLSTFYRVKKEMKSRMGRMP